MEQALETDNWEKLIHDICHEVSQLTGNVLTEKQRPMVESRIRRRMLDLKIETAFNYKNYWNLNKDAENKYLTGLLTTHFTSFFREFSHFEWLLSELPSLVNLAKSEGRAHLKFWSAACSKGQEVWSLCMWLQHHMPKIDSSMSWSVFGTDIDGQSIKEAENAVYHRRELETAPRHLWENLWIRGTGEISDWYKLKKDMRKQAHFSQMNLLNVNLPISEKFDVILCRNVLIYFNRSNQELAIKGLLQHLHPHGALITGMSESLTGYVLPVRGVSPSVYKHQNVVRSAASIKSVVPSSDVGRLQMPFPLRVLCVDDSPTVQMILKKILKAPEFEVVGTALNGEEAIKKIAELKPDAITLDLHMPVMDGMTFLDVTKVAKDLPVIVVSSVGRDHNPLINPLFDLGVCDFVEKPSLTNIDLIGEELCQKLKMGWTAKKQKISLKSNASTLKYRKRPNGQLVFVLGSGDEENFYHILSQQDWRMDELTILYQGPGEKRELLEKKVIDYGNHAAKVSFITELSGLRRSSLPLIWLSMKGFNPQPILKTKNKHDFILVEEGSYLSISNKLEIDDESPATSFSYLIDKLLGGE